MGICGLKTRLPISAFLLMLMILLFILWYKKGNMFESANATETGSQRTNYYTLGMSLYEESVFQN